MNIPMFIGLRYTGAKRRNQLVSFLSAVSMMGLVVGVSLLILVLSIMNGFEKELRERILGVLPQATIYHREGIENWEEVQAQVEAKIGVAAAAPFVELQALVSNKGEAKPIIIYGIDPKQEMRVSRITDFAGNSAIEELRANPDSIILGEAIAKKLDVQVGEQLMLIVPDSQNKRAAPRVKYCTLLALIKTNTEIDQTLALMSIAGAKSMQAVDVGVSGLHLKLDDMFAAREVTWKVVMDLGVGYYGSNWMHSHGNIYHAIKTSKSLVGLLMSLIVAIAAFNVVSTLVMVVVDKQGDIAILRTLGASTRQIMSIFMIQGIAIGTIGTLLGAAVGIGLALIVENIVAYFEAILGVQFLKSDVYPLTYLPTRIMWQDVMQVTVTAMGLSFLATIYPAWRASRTDPADALRYE